MNTDDDTQLYLPRLNPEDCKCDVHNLENDAWKIKYKQLSDKERRLRDELTKINREITRVSSLIIDSEPTVQSVFKTDYGKRHLPITQYRPLMSAVKSLIKSPITLPIVDVKDAYKDPIRFRYSAMETAMIQPIKTIALLKVPETFTFWEKPFIGNSEFMDNISKVGLCNMRNQQQYMEPLIPRGKSCDCDP